MPEADAPWRVRIATEDGIIVGAGILIDERTVLTAGSVVQAAIGTTEPDEARFQITFQAADGSPITARWLTMVGTSTQEGSALLGLDDPAPRGTGVADLTDVDEGVRVRAYGYPQNFDDGLWSTARTVSRGGPGGRWIQLTPGEPQISAGFGGAGAVDDTGRVVGMIMATARDRTGGGVSAAWMMPGGLLRAMLDSELVARRVLPPEGDAFPLDLRGGEWQSFPKRAQALADLLDRLKGTLPGGPVVVVTGSPGSGKSSLLRAARSHVGVRDIHLAGATAEVVRTRLARQFGVPDEQRADVLAQRLAETARTATSWFLDDVELAAEPDEVITLLRRIHQAGRSDQPARLVVAGAREVLAPLIEAGVPVIDHDSERYFDIDELVRWIRYFLTGEGGRNAFEEMPERATELAERLADLAGTDWDLAASVAQRLATRPGVDPDELPAIVAEWTANRRPRPAPTSAPPEQEADPAGRDWGHAAPRIQRDYWTTEDWLSHRHHARAIAAFLRHRDTKPPLTIGVKGAWGTGKTSLMRMVQEILDPGAAREKACRIRFDSESGERIQRWLGQEGGEQVSNEAVVRAASSVEEPEETEAGKEELRADPVEAEGDGWRATVWFNPWMYQSGDQVWAGLAHEIIRQVTGRLSVADRERFWLRLNLARVDREAVRRRWHRILLGRLVPLLAWWVVLTLVAVGLAVVAVGLRAAGVLAPVLQVVSWGGGGVWTLGSVALAGMSVWRWVRTARAPAAGALGRLIQQPPMLRGIGDDLGVGGPETVDPVVPEPGYAQRLGFLHLVQTDMRRVLDLVATEKRPLVVFVDDLDRCSPGTVAQVIEAVNLFLAGEFPNCVFVLAFDPVVVATHVEVAYKDLAGAVTDTGWSSLGWRFLEKIVQLPLGLPPPDPERDITRYVDQLLGAGGDPGGPAAEPVPRRTHPEDVEQPPDPDWRYYSPSFPQSLYLGPTTSERIERYDETQAQADARGARETEDRLVEEIRRRGPSTGTLAAAAGAAQREVLGRDGPLGAEALAAAERVFADLYSDRGARPAILAALPALGSRNPRELKRYVNLFRFYTFVAERERLRGLPAPGGDQIAKLAAFAIRWPQLTSRFGAARRDEPHPLAVLEEAARADGDADAAGWLAALAGAGLGGTGQPAWGPALRAFLVAEPAIGGVACRLL